MTSICVFHCCLLKAGNRVKSRFSCPGSGVLPPTGRLDSRCCHKLEAQALAWGRKAGSPVWDPLPGRKERGGEGPSGVSSLLTSFCSSSGSASVSRVIQKEQGAMWAVININSSLAASENRFSPYSRWNSRYFPTHGCWWRVKRRQCLPGLGYGLSAGPGAPRKPVPAWNASGEWNLGPEERLAEKAAKILGLFSGRFAVWTSLFANWSWLALGACRVSNGTSGLETGGVCKNREQEGRGGGVNFLFGIREYQELWKAALSS